MSGSQGPSSGGEKGEEHDDNFYFQATWNMVKRIADQISHPALAVGEIIKNSYDADATQVLVNMKQSMNREVVIQLLAKKKLSRTNRNLKEVRCFQPV